MLLLHTAREICINNWTTFSKISPIFLQAIESKRDRHHRQYRLVTSLAVKVIKEPADSGRRAV